MKQEYVAPGSIVVVYEDDPEPAKYCRSTFTVAVVIMTIMMIR